ncbi:hypothetical protein LTR53_001579 [Teratosphaeriaceae sp. CCFEE 6253]|nr:hypothetical protein LTR53_001579 [Teratosphaeriaceae sp. CCFEE 6253]
MALYSIAKRTHWLGVALLLITSILLLITTISAPIINHISLLRVTLTNSTQIRHSSVAFGTFGYCLLDVPPTNTEHDWCTRRHIGYKPADVMARIDRSAPSEMVSGTSDALTHVMVLHPIACGLAFVAFLAALGSGVIGSLIGALAAFIAWVLVLASIAVDFSLFGIIKHHVNRDHSGSKARFGTAIWLLLASFVSLFFGMLLVFFTCCTAHREKKRAREAETHGNYPLATTNGVVAQPRKKRFVFF